MKRETILKNIRMLFLLFVLVLTATIANAQLDVIIGDSPSYISFEQCPEHAQYVIEQKNISKNTIHACTQEIKTLQNIQVNLVYIEYGEAQDCPAGCFYKNMYIVTPDDHSYIQEVPPRSLWLNHTLKSRKPFSEPQSMDYSCSPNFDNIVELQLDRKNLNIGWALNLTKPYQCTWFSIDKTQMTTDSTFIHTGKRMKRTLSGKVFVYMEDNSIQWDDTGLKVSEKVIKKEKITKPY